MTETIRVEITPEVIMWARKQRGLQVHAAAKRLGISDGRLEQVESGELNPTLTQLRKMSEVYKRPLIVLLLSEVPTSFQPLTDYRTLSADDTGDYSPALLDEIRRAITQRHTYLELLVDLGHEAPVIDLPQDRGDAEALASDLRDVLNISYEQQKQWRQPEDAYAEWRARVESLGIIVIETSRVELTEMRGFSIAEESPYVIAVNGMDAPRGKIFTMLHELAHLCGRHWGVCDLHQRGQRRGDVEVYCNAVAGEALMPGSILQQTSVFKAHTAGVEWSDTELDELVLVAGGASRDSIMRRLLQIGSATPAEYERRHDEFIAAYEEMRKVRRSKKKKGGPPPYRMQIRDRGKPFIRSVLDAYAERLITLSDVSDLAGVRVKHLSNLQREAYR